MNKNNTKYTTKDIMIGLLLFATFYFLYVGLYVLH